MRNIRPALTTSKPIKSLASLESTLGLSSKQLSEILDIPECQKYVEKAVPKPDGSLRTVYRPHPLIRKAQRRINNNIFKEIVIWPSYVFGSLPNSVINQDEIERKDYISCAAQHCGAKSLLKMDIKSFFDNIHIDYVNHMFCNFFDYSSDVADILSRLCCRGDFIVQGGLTSSYVASLILWEFEPKLVKRLTRKKLIYTRLVDDISISSKISNFDFSMTKSLVTNTLHELDLPVNERKTKVSYVSTEPLSVHGIRVNFKEPRLPSNEVRRIRAAVHNLTVLASQPGYRTTHDYRSDFSRCMGRVNKLKRVEHEKHKDFLEILQNIKPLPSPKDLKRAREMLGRLERDYTTQSGSRGYRTRFFRLQERLNVLSRKKEYLNDAKKIRHKLKSLKPDETARSNF
ncbi:reverse transcriptase family protein [Vibrio diabolicus]|uniref:reverse transcriptase family protein n=1 Tax=Vibrio diabolicus TaxID=50719 RepID=UPI003D7DE2DA